MSGTVGTIARTAATLWVRELAVVFGVKRRALMFALGAFAVAMLVFSVFLAWTLASFFSSVTDATPAADQRTLLRLVFAGLMLGSTVYFLVLCASLPSRDRLSTVLSLLPVEPWRGAVAVQLPAVIVGAAVAVVFGLPTLPMILKLVDPQRFSLPGIVAFLATILLAAVLVPALFFVIRDVCVRKLRLPVPYALAVAVVTVLVTVLSFSAADLVPRATMAPGEVATLLAPTRALSEVLQPASSEPIRLVVSGAALVTWFTGAFALAYLAVRTSRPIEARTVAPPTVRIRPRGGRSSALVTFEMVMVMRLPQFVVTVLVVVLCAAALPIVYAQPDFRLAVDQLASLPVIMACAIGAYSFGATRRHHWVASLTTKTGTWCWPKMAATIVLSASLAVPYLVVASIAGIPAERIVDYATLGLGMWAAAALAGILVPFAQDQSLSATVTSASTVAIWAMSTFALRWAWSTVGVDSPVAAAVSWVVIVLAAYAVLAHGSRDPVGVDA